MKAITVRQPWASLIAAGVKTIETRPRRTGYRGRIAIHAAKRLYTAADKHADRALWHRAHDVLAMERNDGVYCLPYGEVVASAVLTDCVPIVGEDGDLDRDSLDYACVEHRPADAYNAGLWLWPAEDEGEDMAEPADITRQLPFGDFSPGRWALLLDDIKPTTERCPYCWGSAMTGLCDRTDLGSDGPCVMRSGHADRGSPCWGENDVAGDWPPAASCRMCCVCPCGSTDDGTECPYCHTTRTPGRCDPVPARGQQAVPWEWTP